MKIRHLLIPILALLAGPSLGAQQTNLIPNPDFSDAKNPLAGWRIDFPFESFYVNNVKYVAIDNQLGKKCAVINLPPGIAGNQGGKIETALVKVEPGATYRVEIDCMTWDFSAKIETEVWSHDPKPDEKRGIFRIPATDDHPAMAMCYRAQVPDPPTGSKKWSTAAREFTVPESVTVSGEDQKPEYISIKAVVYAATPNGGKSYFTNFHLYKIKSGAAPTPSSTPQ
jgi:hypothetical protein